MLGVRESRRIEGEYTLDTDDLLEGRMPEDSVTTAAFNIDIHEPNAIGQQNRQVKPYGIPYRCMLPKGVENLLVAGRSISGTHVAMASYRVTADCAAMGEAAGKAAAYAVKTGKTVRNISPKEFLV